MQHEAIYALHPTVVRIEGTGSDAVATDADGNVVSWDDFAVATKEVELLAAFKLDKLRAERNRLLAETDWWDMSDTPTMTAAQTTYRQALRDITDTYQSLDTVVWPTKP